MLETNYFHYFTYMSNAQIVSLIDMHTMKVQLLMTFLPQPWDKGKVNDAQQVVVFVNISNNTISITVINSFTIFIFQILLNFS